MHAQRRLRVPPDDQNEPTACGGSDVQESAQRYPRNFSFQSRRSALSPAQQRTWQRLWPQLGTEAQRSMQAGPDGRLDAHRWFGRDAPLVLEIGSGTGAATVTMAQAEPEIDVIAVEVYRRGLAQLLCAIERAGPENLSNIRLIRGDAVDVLEHMVTPASLSGVRVFFPDPWPKARHHKRRLLQPATVALIADLLKPGGVLHAATDHAEYAEQIAAAGDGEPRLQRVAPSTALPISIRRPTTKYEAKAQEAGSPVTELMWTKGSDTDDTRRDDAERSDEEERRR